MASDPPQPSSAEPSSPEASSPEPSSPEASSPEPSSPEASSPARRGWAALALRWAKRAMVAGMLLAVAGVLTVYLTLRHYEQDLPSIEELKHYDPPQVTRVLARDGSLLAELFVQRRTVVSIVAIPKSMKVAVLAAEDADFYRHEGLDYLGMLRALVVNLRTGSTRQGGSTITQQVVKNVLLTPERTFARKSREVLLARRIEQALSKDEILELYLNHIYFGHGRYGVEEAAQYYFGKSGRKLNLAEAALLAGLAKGPSVYSPRVNIARSRQRRNAVLEQIADKGFASRALVDKAKRAAIVLAPASEKLAALAPEVVSEARRLLRRLVGPAAARGGYTIATTIDPQLQAAARRALRDNLDAYAKRHGWLAPLEKRRRGKRHKQPAPTPFQGTPKSTGHHVYTAVVTGANDAEGLLEIRVGATDGSVLLSSAKRYNPKGLPPSRFAPKGTLLRVSPIVERDVGPDGVPHAYRLELGPQGALVAIDVKTREVLALVGSYEATRGGLDRATSARRQPGSTFKPFVYSYGIHSRRLTPASVIAPQPARVATDKPPLLLRQALARSVNAAATWALRELGAESVAAWAHAVGIQSKLAATDSLALGAYELTPRELAGAYATFAGAGVYQQPLLIRSITGPDGKNVPLPAMPPARQVLDEAEAYVVTSLLSSVIRSGTGRRARALRLPLAGKTGTSNDAKDAWFAGYSPAIVCVSWTGFDDAVSLGKREAGATAALPAFISFMRAAHRTRKVKPWPQPKGVTRDQIDPQTGLLAYPGQTDAISEIFVAGTEPSEAAEPPDAGVDDADADADAGTESDADAGAGPQKVEPPNDAGSRPVATPTASPASTTRPPAVAPSAQPPPF